MHDARMWDIQLGPCARPASSASLLLCFSISPPQLLVSEFLDDANGELARYRASPAHHDVRGVACCVAAMTAHCLRVAAWPRRTRIGNVLGGIGSYLWIATVVLVLSMSKLSTVLGSCYSTTVLLQYR